MVHVNSLAHLKGFPPQLHMRARDVFAEKPEELAKIGVSDKDWKRVVMSLSRAWGKNGFSEYPCVELSCLATLCCCCACICVFGAIGNHEAFATYCKTTLVDEASAALKKYRISCECVQKGAPHTLVFYHHPKAGGHNGEGKE